MQLVNVIMTLEIDETQVTDKELLNDLREVIEDMLCMDNHCKQGTEIRSIALTRTDA